MHESGQNADKGSGDASTAILEPRPKRRTTRFPIDCLVGGEEASFFPSAATAFRLVLYSGERLSEKTLKWEQRRGDRIRLPPRQPGGGRELSAMRAFRFLFAPELGRPISDALRSAAVLRTLIEAVRRPESSPAARGAGPRNAVSRFGLLWLVLLLGAAGLGLTALPLPGPASAQAIERGLFADTDSLAREVLTFLEGLGADNPSAVAYRHAVERYILPASASPAWTSTVAPCSTREWTGAIDRSRN